MEKLVKVSSSYGWEHLNTLEEQAAWASFESGNGLVLNLTSYHRGNFEDETFVLEIQNVAAFAAANGWTVIEITIHNAFDYFYRLEKSGLLVAWSYDGEDDPRFDCAFQYVSGKREYLGRDIAAIAPRPDCSIPAPLTIQVGGENELDAAILSILEDWNE